MSVPGLQKRARKNGTVAWYWVATSASRLARDYPTKIRRLDVDTEDEAAALAWTFTAELRQWLAEGNAPVAYTGTLGSLIDCYKADETSPYNAVRANTRQTYEYDLRTLKSHVGKVRVAPLARPDFFRWHKNFAAPATEGGDRRIRRAHGLMTMVRMLLSFGASMRYDGCASARDAIAEMRFEMPAPRRQLMTFAQAAAIVDKAMETGSRSVALGQALQFELGLRQIDVIGSWIATTEKTGGLVRSGRQWTGGITWADLTAERLAKRTSKTGQEGNWRVADYPLLVKAIAAFADGERVGPAIIDERTGKPYVKRMYWERWREVANASGLPKTVWNMDSRAGAITEGEEAGADPEDMRKFATHADRQTTQRYVRDTSRAIERVAHLRVEHRGKEAK